MSPTNASIEGIRLLAIFSDWLVYLQIFGQLGIII